MGLDQLTKTAKWILNPNVDATFRKSNLFGGRDKNNAVNFGYAFHEIMARIYVKTDVEEAIQFVHNQGQIRISQLDQLLNLINQLVHHPELEIFLTPITSNTMKEPFYAPMVRHCDQIAL